MIAKEYFTHTWDNTTTLHPVGLAAVVILGAAMICLPRRHALLPILMMAVFISPAQRIVVLTLDFNLLRVLVLCGWMRVLFRQEFGGFKWKPIDTFFLLFVLCGATAYSILHGEGSAVVNRMGWAYDRIGMYFLFRFLIRDLRDVDRIAKNFTFLGVLCALAFLIEHFTQKNIFSVFGGVPPVTIVREGRLRCQGAFAHSILAGCFWAAVIPNMASQWWSSGRGRVLALVGVSSALLIVTLCASATPVVAVAVALMGGLAFYFRLHMRAIRWLTLLGLVGLHLVMKAPVWHLVSRIQVVGGSTGWHRYKVIDESINHFSEWWLLGTESTAHWGRGLHDITNHYVFVGVTGGVLTLILFLLVIWHAFQGVGRMWRSVRGNPWGVALSWSLGASLLVHTANFIAVSYFGQIILLWFLHLGAIGSLTPMAAPASSQRQLVRNHPRPSRRSASVRRIAESVDEEVG